MSDIDVNEMIKILTEIDRIAIGLESAADHLRAGEKPRDIAVRLREMADQLEGIE